MSTDEPCNCDQALELGVALDTARAEVKVLKNDVGALQAEVDRLKQENAELARQRDGACAGANALDRLRHSLCDKIDAQAKELAALRRVSLNDEELVDGEGRPHTLDSVTDDIAFMQRRLNAGQGTPASAMCRLSLSAAQWLLRKAHKAAEAVQTVRDVRAHYDEDIWGPPDRDPDGKLGVYPVDNFSAAGARAACDDILRRLDE
jgi:uncharacterized small protein (DUF1192 family)